MAPRKAILAIPSALLICLLLLRAAARPARAQYWSSTPAASITPTPWIIVTPEYAASPTATPVSLIDLFAPRRTPTPTPPGATATSTPSPTP